jgi:hypothetical protein
MKGFIRDYSDKIYVYKWNDLDEIDTFLNRTKVKKSKENRKSDRMIKDEK